MRILLITEYFWPHIGGVEVVFENIAENLTRLGHEVDVVTGRVDDSPTYEERLGVRIHRVSVPKRFDRYCFAFLAIPKVLKLARRADLIHTTLHGAAIPGFLAAKLFQKKALLSVHEIFVEKWRELGEGGVFWANVHRALESLLLKLNFSYYIAVSDATMERFKLLTGRKNVARIYNGINENIFKASSENPLSLRSARNLPTGFLYLYYGRPGVSKGLEYLLAAVPITAEKIPGSRLVLILSHKPVRGYQKMLKLIKKLGIEKEIILLNPMPIKELVPYVQAADCVVVPSLSEGFGFTAAESSALKVPIVCSNTASLPEVVSGRVVFSEPKNPQSIAEGICKVYRKEYLEIPEKIFSWEKSVAEYLKIYEKMVKEEGTRC